MSQHFIIKPLYHVLLLVWTAEFPWNGEANRDSFMSVLEGSCCACWPVLMEVDHVLMFAVDPQGILE